MTKLAKTSLVATSIAPVLLLCGLFKLEKSRLDSWVNAYKFEKESWADIQTPFMYLIGSLLLVGFFVLIFFHQGKKEKAVPLKLDKVKSADKEVLAFMLAYLLPFLTRDAVDFQGSVFVIVALLLVFGFIVYHSTAYTFNPLLPFCGYSFYEVESQGMTYLLISKRCFHSPKHRIMARHFSDYIYVDEYEHGDPILPLCDPEEQ